MVACVCVFRHQTSRKYFAASPFFCVAIGIYSWRMISPFFQVIDAIYSLNHTSAFIIFSLEFLSQAITLAFLSFPSSEHHRTVFRLQFIILIHFDSLGDHHVEKLFDRLRWIWKEINFLFSVILFSDLAGFVCFNQLYFPSPFLCASIPSNGIPPCASNKWSDFN